MQPICASQSIPRLHDWSLRAFIGAGVAAAMFLAVYVKLGWHEGLGYVASHQATATASWGIFVVALGVAGLHDARRRVGPGRTLLAASIAVFCGTILSSMLLWATSPDQVALAMTFVSGSFVLLAVLAIHLVYPRLRELGFGMTRCLVIGTSQDAKAVIELIHRYPQAGLKAMGIVHCGKGPAAIGTPIAGCRVLGTEASLKRLVSVHRVDKLIVAAPREVDTVLLRRLRSFRYRGLAVADYVSLNEELTQEIPIEHIDDEWLFAASMNSSRPHIRRFKRTLDVAASIVALVLTAPLLAVAALLIKLDSKGPIHFRQERLGRDRVPFTILKLRTMTADAESRSGPVWATTNDPRITRIGRWLRKFRIDELPQFVNVLRGEMSLIGPRPEREVFVNQLTEQVPFYAERFMVQPGITGWAQVMQSYAASVEESRRKLQADLYYIKHISFLTDMFIILKTIKVVLLGLERNPSIDANESVGELVTERNLSQSRGVIPVTAASHQHAG